MLFDFVKGKINDVSPLPLSFFYSLLALLLRPSFIPFDFTVQYFCCSYNIIYMFFYISEIFQKVGISILCVLIPLCCFLIPHYFLIPLCFLFIQLCWHHIGLQLLAFLCCVTIILYCPPKEDLLCIISYFLLLPAFCLLMMVLSLMLLQFSSHFHLLSSYSIHFERLSSFKDSSLDLNCC